MSIGQCKRGPCENPAICVVFEIMVATRFDGSSPVTLPHGNTPMCESCLQERFKPLKTILDIAAPEKGD